MYIILHYIYTYDHASRDARFWGNSSMAVEETRISEAWVLRTGCFSMDYRLVVWNMTGWFSMIYGMSSETHWRTHIFQIRLSIYRTSITVLSIEFSMCEATGQSVGVRRVSFFLSHEQKSAHVCACHPWQEGHAATSECAGAMLFFSKRKTCYTSRFQV